jgi:hypothetical protein
MKLQRLNFKTSIEEVVSWAYFRGGGERAIVYPDSVFKDFIICEAYISNFFNVDHFIMKYNYA